MAKLVVLVVEETELAAQALKRGLQLGGHDVHTTTFGAKDLPKKLLERVWDVVVCEWARGRVGTPEIIAELRQAASANGGSEPLRPWVVVATAKPVASTIEQAFAAGADDFVRKPIVKEELFVRIAGAERFTSRRPHRTQARPAVSSPYTKKTCWKTFAPSTAECLRMMMGSRDIRLVDESSARKLGAAYASSLTLSVPDQGAEFRVLIEIESLALAAMGADFLGETTPASLLDLLHEIANTVGGTFMRGGLAEQLMMTTSLPSMIDVREIRTVLDGASAKTSAYLQDPSGGGIAVHLVVRERRNVAVPVTKLREGMVLANDLCTESGTLLLKAGTRITSTASERVAAILGGGVTIEIAEGAA